MLPFCSAWAVCVAAGGEEVMHLNVVGQGTAQDFQIPICTKGTNMITLVIHDSIMFSLACKAHHISHVFYLIGKILNIYKCLD